jgi:AcrR family transcriptional regulator
VAKAAGVAEGTIFHHFKSKDGLLIYIFEELMSSYLKEAHVQIDEADTGLDAVDRFIRFHFRSISEFAKESLVISQDIPAHFSKPDFPNQELVVNHVSQIVRLLKASIERGQKDGSIWDVVVDKPAFILEHC